MSTRCAECGAPLGVGQDCRDLFHALLALEWEVPGGPGELAHFFAVSSYVLQHPRSMGYTQEALAWLRGAVRGALARSLSVADLRHGARTDSKTHGGRVLRCASDPVAAWNVGEWSMNVTDALAHGTEGYANHVEQWARAVTSDIDASTREEAPQQ